MLLVRRKTTRRGSFTVLMLPGGYVREFPTSDHEHRRILEIFLQDQPYPGVVNDFSRFGLGRNGHTSGPGGITSAR